MTTNRSLDGGKVGMFPKPMGRVRIGPHLMIHETYSGFALRNSSWGYSGDHIGHHRSNSASCKASILPA